MPYADPERQRERSRRYYSANRERKLAYMKARNDAKRAERAERGIVERPKRPKKPHSLSTTERGYGGEHQKLRRQWAARVATGTVCCWRCGRLIRPGSLWHLGHDDFDRSRYRGPEHRACNLGAAARMVNRKRSRRAGGVWPFVKR